MTAGVVALIALLAGTSAGMALADIVLSSSAARTAKMRLGDGMVNQRERVLSASAWRRVAVPALQSFVGAAKRRTPGGYTDKVTKKLRAAGQGDSQDVERFIIIRLVTLGLAAPVSIGAYMLLGGGMKGMAVAGLSAMLLVLGPDASVSRKIEAREKSVSKELPDVIDLLVISLEAGLGFEQAVARTCSASSGALGEEFLRMLNEMRAGSSRADAMRGMAQRVDVEEMRSFVLAVLQADSFGVSIGRILHSQADELRVRRRQHAQEKAMKAPVKMLIPMVFCIFPAIFVVILGPAALQIMRELPGA